MSLFPQIILAWQGMRRTVRHLATAAVWVPWLIVGGLQLAVLVCLWGFAHPWISWFMAPLLQRVGGEAMLRYPNVFRVMPALYGRAALVIGVLVGAVMGGAAIWLFARRFLQRESRPGEGLRLAVRRAFSLIVANLPAAILTVLVLALSEWWVQEKSGPRILQTAARFGGLGLALVLQALFAYVSAVVVLEGKGVLEAWRRIGECAARGFWAALLLSVVLFLPHLPVDYLGRHAQTIAQRGVPELVGLLVAAEIALGVVTSLVFSGGIALVYLTAISESEA